MKRPKILVVQPMVKEGFQVLDQAGMEVAIPAGTDAKFLMEAVRDCEAILVRTALIPREVIEAGNQLKVIARHGIGTDNIDVEAASEQGIFVCNVPHSNVNSVAEHAVGLMLSLAHHISKADKALRQGRFEVRNEYIGGELKGKNLGLIGFGNIGRLVAQKCGLGLGMNVLVYDPYVKELKDMDYAKLMDSMDGIFGESDFVSLHLPYLPEMHHFINEEALSKMKRSAYLINCARGGLVDEEALYEAIKAGEIAGAGLDVFEQEPAPVSHPLWELEQVIVTPHMAAHTQEAMINMAVGAAEEIVSVLQGEGPQNAVNKNKIKGVRA